MADIGKEFLEGIFLIGSASVVPESAIGKVFFGFLVLGILAIIIYFIVKII